MERTKLIPGEAYFWCGFADKGLTIPTISTLQYIGTETSRSTGGREAHVFTVPTDENKNNRAYIDNESLDGLYDFEGMLALVKAAGERRKSK